MIIGFLQFANEENIDKIYTLNCYMQTDCSFSSVVIAFINFNLITLVTNSIIVYA